MDDDRLADRLELHANALRAARLEEENEKLKKELQIAQNKLKKLEKYKAQERINRNSDRR